MDTYLGGNYINMHMDLVLILGCLLIEYQSGKKSDRFVN